MTKTKKVQAGRHKVLYTETKSSVDASVHTKETNTSISAYPLHILHVKPSKTNKKSLIIIWILVLLFISSPDWLIKARERKHKRLVCLAG